MPLRKGLSVPLTRLYVGYDKELMDITVNAFAIYSFSYLVGGINIFASAFFTALGNGRISAIVSFSRTLVFQVLVVIILPMIWGINGIWWATFIAELIAMSISVYYLVKAKGAYLGL